MTTKTKKPAKGIHPAACSSFPPYIAPCYQGGTGPLTPGLDLLHAVSDGKHVTPAVIGAVAWAISHATMGDVLGKFGGSSLISRQRIAEFSAKATASLLDELGLESVRSPMGGQHLRPKEAYR